MLPRTSEQHDVTTEEVRQYLRFFQELGDGSSHWEEDDEPLGGALAAKPAASESTRQQQHQNEPQPQQPRRSKFFRPLLSRQNGSLQDSLSPRSSQYRSSSTGDWRVPPLSGATKPEVSSPATPQQVVVGSANNKER